MQDSQRNQLQAPARLLRRTAATACAVFAGILVACGGGSSGSDPGVAPAPTQTRIYTEATTFAGSGWVGHEDSKSTPASFDMPMFVAANAGGTLFVADTNNHTIRKILSNGQVSTWAGSGTAGASDAVGVAATFNHPEGIALDASGSLCVSEWTGKLRKVTVAGEVSTLLGQVKGAIGWGLDIDGPLGVASFNAPRALAFDAKGYLFVATTGNVIRKLQ